MARRFLKKKSSLGRGTAAVLQFSHQPLIVNVVVVGPFEEEEERTGIASDVVKVKGENPATIGEYLKSVDTGTPRARNDSPASP